MTELPELTRQEMALTTGMPDGTEYERNSGIWVNCKDASGIKCAIYVEKNNISKSIIEGDTVWWQSDFAYWTPEVMDDIEPEDKKQGIHFDIKIKRLGYSGVPRPQKRKENDYLQSRQTHKYPWGI